jgi:predicted transposase/invertase (TIGR01784 family)
MKFVSPRNDLAFKKIFGNENRKNILISFLNAVLNLQGDRTIEDLEILNPYQAPRIQELKYSLLDVQARDKRGVTFIVEMQVEYVAGYEKRFLYYSSKAYVSQIERAVDYPRLNQVIFIGILDFKAFTGENYLTRHLILNTSTGRQEIKDLEFNFIELPKFTKTEAELETLLDKWIFFLKHAEDLEVIPENVDDTALRDAYEVANKFGWTKQEMELYDYWDIQAQDARGAVEAARTQGLEEGMQKGMQKGQLLTLRQNILDAITLRFQPSESDYAALETSLARINEEQTLRTLFRQVMQAETIADVRQAVEALER